MTTTTLDFEPQVGDFVSYTLVTDTQVYEVVKRTPHTATLRRTRPGENLRSENRDGNPYPVVHTEAVSDPTGPTQVVRRRKDGTFRIADWSRPLRPATEIDGKPVTRTDYRF